MNQLANFSGKTVEHERQDSFLEAAVTSFWIMQYIHSDIKSKESQNLKTQNIPTFCYILSSTAILKPGNHMSIA